MAPSAATRPSRVRATASMSSNERAASTSRSSSSGRSPRCSVRDSSTGFRSLASCGLRSVSTRSSSCSYRAGPSPNSGASTGAGAPRPSRGPRRRRAPRSGPCGSAAGRRRRAGRSRPRPGRRATKCQRVTRSLCRCARSPMPTVTYRAAVAELHPHVRVGRLLAAVEQVGLHRPVLAGERVEPARLDAPVEHEREQHLQRLRLARPVRPAQHQPAVDEEELLVAVVPEVDDPRPGGGEPRAILSLLEQRSLVEPGDGVAVAADQRTDEHAARHRRCTAPNRASRSTASASSRSGSACQAAPNAEPYRWRIPATALRAGSCRS